MYMTQNYKRKLIRRVEKLLLESKSSLLDVVIDYGMPNPRTGKRDSFIPLTLRELLLVILEVELGELRR